MPRTSSTLQVGSLAPEFQLETATGECLALAAAPGTPLVLVFIRGTW